jgi:antitoxin VapB
MALNLKNDEVESLATEVARLAGETKTEAIRVALAERRARLRLRAAGGAAQQRVQRFLEEEVWPTVPPDQLGRRLTAEEEDAILGYGPDGT